MKNLHVLALKLQVLAMLKGTSSLSVIAKALDVKTQDPHGTQNNWFLFWLVQDMIEDGTVEKFSHGNYRPTGKTYDEGDSNEQ
jgi:hypothetical protein